MRLGGQCMLHLESDKLPKMKSNDFMQQWWDTLSALASQRISFDRLHRPTGRSRPSQKRKCIGSNPIVATTLWWHWNYPIEVLIQNTSSMTRPNGWSRLHHAVMGLSFKDRHWIWVWKTRMDRLLPSQWDTGKFPNMFPNGTSLFGTENLMAPWISEAGTSNELRTRHPLSVRIGSVSPFYETWIVMQSWIL